MNPTCVFLLLVLALVLVGTNPKGTAAALRSMPGVAGVSRSTALCALAVASPVSW